MRSSAKDSGRHFREHLAALSDGKELPSPLLRALLCLQNALCRLEEVYLARADLLPGLVRAFPVIQLEAREGRAIEFTPMLLKVAFYLTGGDAIAQLGRFGLASHIALEPFVGQAALSQPLVRVLGLVKMADLAEA